MRQEYLRSLVIKKYGNYLDATNDFRVNCTFCHKNGRSPDHEYKLYLSWDKEMAHCFRCDYAEPLKYLFVGQTLSQIEERDDDIQKRKAAFKLEAENHNIELIPDSAILLSSLEYEHPAMQYMRSRNIELPPELLYCDNYFRRKENGHHAYYGARIIFPVYFNGVYQGFQARTINNHPVKYVNGEGFEKSLALYNWDRARSSSTVVLVEGIIDALNVGLNRAIAIFGKALSDRQRDLILYQRFSKIVIILDKDAVKNSKKIAGQLSLFNNNVWYAKIKWKDPGEAPHDKLNEMIDSGLSHSSHFGLQRAF